MNKDKNDDDGNKGTYPPKITYGMTLLCQVVNLRMDRRKKFPLQATGHCPIPRDCSAVQSDRYHTKGEALNRVKKW